CSGAGGAPLGMSAAAGIHPPFDAGVRDPAVEARPRPQVEAASVAPDTMRTSQLHDGKVQHMANGRPMLDQQALDASAPGTDDAAATPLPPDASIAEFRELARQRRFARRSSTAREDWRAPATDGAS